jgi:TRAP-type C4-dicarboxylate transport system permease small subunit
MAMMLLTFTDVVARYVFRRPVRGAFEITELMLLVLIFAGLPLVSFTDEHAVMDFVDRVLGARSLRGLERLCGRSTPPSCSCWPGSPGSRPTASGPTATH